MINVKETLALATTKYIQVTSPTWHVTHYAMVCTLSPASGSQNRSVSREIVWEL